MTGQRRKSGPSPAARRSSARRRPAAAGAPALHPTRKHAARHLLSPAQWQESLAIAPPVSLHIACVAGLQSALAVLVAIVAVHFSPWPHLVGFPALGALAALFGRFAPVGRQRMRIVAICAALLTLAVLLPSLASLLGASPVVLVLVLALVAGGATVAVAHWQLGGPGAVIIVFAAGAALGQQVMRHAGTWPLGFVGAACEVAALAVLFVAMRRKRRRPRQREFGLAVPGAPPVR